MTGRTDMECIGVRDKRMAEVTEGRKKNVKQRIEVLPDGSHLKTEVGVYNQYMEIGKTRLSIDNRGYPAEPVR